MPLNTRRPTGAVPFPMLLLEGEEKAGKSYAARALSASELVGRTFVFDLGEVPSDEYAALGRFEIVEHGGTYHGLRDQLAAAIAEPSEPGRPTVIVLDTATALWGMLCDWANERARRSRAGQRALAADPDAEIDPSMNLWNDAKDRWWAIINMLRAWPGLAVLVARGGEVTKVVGGAPVAGETVYRVEAEKGLPYAVTATVRMTRTPRRARLVAATSLHLQERLARGDALELPLERTLEHVVFELLGAGVNFVPSGAQARAETGYSVGEAKQSLLATAQRTERSADTAKAQAAAAWTWARLEGPGITRAQLALATDALLKLQRGEALGELEEAAEPDPAELEATVAHLEAEAGDDDDPRRGCARCGEPHLPGECKPEEVAAG